MLRTPVLREWCYDLCDERYRSKLGGHYGYSTHIRADRLMTLYNAAQAMVHAHDYASKLLDQLEKGVSFHAPLRRETGRLAKEMPDGPLKDEALGIDKRTTEIVDDIRALQTHVLELRGRLNRFGQERES